MSIKGGGGRSWPGRDSIIRIRPKRGAEASDLVDTPSPAPALASMPIFEVPT